MNKVLSIDPGGKTGLYFTDGKEKEFFEINNKNWKENYLAISQLVKEKQPNLLLYEDTNYISQRTKDSLNLFRLLGAIESLGFVLPVKIEKINVLKVKELYKKILAGQTQIEGLIYQVGRGKGWKYQEQRISLHQLDALIIYYLWIQESLGNTQNMKKKVKYNNNEQTRRK